MIFGEVDRGRRVLQIRHRPTNCVNDVERDVAVTEDSELEEFWSDAKALAKKGPRKYPMA